MQCMAQVIYETKQQDENYRLSLSIRQKQSHLLHCIYSSYFVVYFLFSILSILYGLIHKMSLISFFPPTIFSFLIFFQLLLFIMCSSTCLNHRILGHLMDSFPLIFNCDEFLNILVVSILSI